VTNNLSDSACTMCEVDARAWEHGGYIAEAKQCRDYCRRGHVEAPKFTACFCSQCGAAIGPGDAGVSRCEDHTAIRAEVDRLSKALVAAYTDIEVLTAECDRLRKLVVGTSP
jgi:hypothetical protein